MKVILLGELRGKGGEGDVVDVAQGYAENYLFPNRIALPATKGNIKQLEERRHNIAKREEKRLADAEALKENLDGKTVYIDVKVGEEGQLFGSVTNSMIADAVADQLELEIDRKRIELNRNIKTAGRHEVPVNLYRSISATLSLLVGITAEEEAEAAAEETEAEVAETAVEAVVEEADETAEEADAEAAEAEEQPAEETEAETEEVEAESAE